MSTPNSYTLSHVNTPLASTWNKLHINDIALEVFKPQSTGAVYARLPQIFRKLEVGVGAQALEWIEAAAHDAHYIEVASHTTLDEPIVISLNDGDVVDYGVHVRSGASARIVVVAQGTSSLSAASVRIIAEAHAHVELTEIIACASTHEHLEAIGIQASEAALIEIKQYLLGGKTLAAGLRCALQGKHSEVKLLCRYVATNKEQFDINHLVQAYGRDTKEDLVTSGFLGEGASKTLRETIDLVHGSKGSVGNESETVVIAGEHVVNKTLPTILCDEDDVQGNHGATIGSIGDESLGYLANRGLSDEDSQALFMRAIFDDALIHAPEDTSRAAVIARAQKVLGKDIAQDLALEV